MASSSSSSTSTAASSSSSPSPSMAAFHSSLPSPSPSMVAFHSFPSSPSPSMAVIHSSASPFSLSPSPSIAAFHSSSSSLMAAFHSSSPSPPTPMATSLSSSPSMAAFDSSPTSLMAAIHPCSSSSPSPPMAASSSSTTTAPPEKKILIQCANSQITEVSLTIALQSEKIKKCIEDNSAIVEGRIQVPEVTKPVFDKAIKFCEMEFIAHNSSATSKEKEEVSSFEVMFSQELENLDTLYDLIEAANTLRINSLLDRTCQYAADLMNGKTVQQIRELFSIENDYTPEEEEAVRREHTWLFDK